MRESQIEEHYFIIKFNNLALREFRDPKHLANHKVSNHIFGIVGHIEKISKRILTINQRTSMKYSFTVIFKIYRSWI